MVFLFKDRQIHYTDSGTGTPVLLLHGYLVTSEVWQSYAKKLSENFRVITMDLPGHGMSDSFGTTHTMEFMATVVKELLESLSINKIFLTGHSLGGYVTLAFLELFPDSLTGYSLFHSQPFPDTTETIEKRKKEILLTTEGKQELFYPESINKMFASPNINKFSDTVKRLKETASRLKGEGIIALLNGMMIRPSRLSLLEQGTVPFLWILGAMDNYIPCDDIQKKVKLPSNARVVVLENSGHLGFIEEEGNALKAIIGFVSKLP